MRDKNPEYCSRLGHTWEHFKHILFQKKNAKKKTILIRLHFLNSRSIYACIPIHIIILFAFNLSSFRRFRHKTKGYKTKLKLPMWLGPNGSPMKTQSNFLRC